MAFLGTNFIELLTKTLNPILQISFALFSPGTFHKFSPFNYQCSMFCPQLNPIGKSVQVAVQLRQQVNFMEQIIQQLKKLGLGDHEALIYAALLSASPAGATFVAKKCNLSRSSVYTTLNSLIAKGLVGTTYKNEVKQFIAQDHSTLEQLLKKEKGNLEEKFKTLELLRDSLQVFSRSNLNIPQVIFFEGQEGLKKIYLSMMRQAQPKSTLYLLRDEFVWQPEWKFIFEQDWHERVKRLKIEKNIFTKLLVNDSKIEKQHEKFYKSKRGLEYGFLPSKNAVKQFAIYTIGDIVSILSVEKNNLAGIKITNQNFADNFKNLFKTLWQKSKK